MILEVLKGNLQVLPEGKASPIVDSPAVNNTLNGRHSRSSAKGIRKGCEVGNMREHQATLLTPSTCISANSLSQQKVFPWPFVSKPAAPLRCLLGVSS